MKLLCLAGLLTVLGACKSYEAVAPAGFAAYDHGDDFRAVSSDGVVFRVREVDNEPEADLPFWREALKKRMGDAGYVIVADGDVRAKGRLGYLLQMAAPHGTHDYLYWVALFHAGDELVLVEAAGEASRLGGHKDDLLAAISALEIEE